MKLYLIIFALALAAAGYIGLLRASNKKLKTKLQAETERADKNADEVANRDHIIKAMEGAFKNENDKKKKIHTGSNADKFNASLDVLSNKADSKTS